MMVMASSHAGGIVHYLAGRFPGSIGWLLSPGDFKEPRAWLPYAVDNGKFTAWEKKKPWSQVAFVQLLDQFKLRAHKPRWVVVPDEVGDADKTKRLWREWHGVVDHYGWPLAFAVQDGMTPKDVPAKADVVFVGGTTEWKWRNVEVFARAFERVHVGRVNWHDKLEYCESLNVESVDGTGFFRAGETSDRARHLTDFLEGHRRSRAQMRLIA